MPIDVKLDLLLVQRKISLTRLAKRVGITIANLSVLKRNRGKAIRFSTLDALCRELKCQPGDLLHYIPLDGGSPDSREHPETPAKESLL
jgi:putative transcriptional regulator